MPLQSRPRLTDEQRFQENLAEGQNRELYNKSLNGSSHSRALSALTLAKHAQARKLWAEYVPLADPTIPGPPLTAEIVPGTPVPHADHIKGFINNLASTCGVALITDKYRFAWSVRACIFTFFTLWAHHGHTDIPQETRRQAMAYLESPGFRKMREKLKPLADKVDLAIIIETMWRDTATFRTHRMRMQLILAALLIATSDNPGAILQSNGFCTTNQALSWRDISFHVKPNPSDPLHPIVSVVIRLHRPEDQCTNDSSWKEEEIFPEPPHGRCHCRFSLLLALALLDGIFSDVNSASDILKPVHAPREKHILRIKQDKADLPILRTECFQNGVWSIDDKNAMSYNLFRSQLYYFSLCARFCKHLTPDDLRLAAASLFSTQIGDFYVILRCGSLATRKNTAWPKTYGVVGHFIRLLAIIPSLFTLKKIITWAHGVVGYHVRFALVLIT
ncbi:hypothetical protein EVG20_g3124 [Dentipellis fragilis]|uniref:Uncharacterized protein n=1 Tax=Dentipellis fragilis TaxID=205917 RepID=A0A4Y9Z3X4_9AGAM|nr:hypothetical protein EVG20_g3124 [Dentipellis fragilis]